MAGKKRFEEEEEDLDLVPIMNLVLILIPLLLLSVVFLEVAVVNVTMPKQAMGGQPTDADPTRLQVLITKEGFWITRGTQPMPPIPSCQGASGGATVCLADPNADLPIDQYDWLAFYNTLMQIKGEEKFAEHEQLELAAGAEVPFGVVMRAMDYSRVQRQAGDGEASRGESFDSLDALQASNVILIDKKDEEDDKIKKAPLGLFPLVVLGIPQVK